MSEETITATGRRKNAVAQVRMKAGTGVIEVNDRPFDEYFPSDTLQNTLLFPFQVANCAKQFDLKVSATGGGLMGQVGAIRLAISRALIQVNPELRGDLKKEGLLRRDPRMKERKKPGQPGARKRFQFSKR
ncbi:MAG: 30S ribosomal protein S9 [Verrucomicrobiales bacterium]